MVFLGIIQWLEKNSKTCFYKKHFGFECLGCGIQRSVIELLKGNIIESIRLFPALIPILLMCVFLPIHLRFNITHGASILKGLFFLTVILIIGNFLIKLF